MGMRSVRGVRNRSVSRALAARHAFGEPGARGARPFVNGGH